MKPSTPEIEAVLVDVRRAYRLLHDYQRMVLDAVDYLAKQLGMNYRGGWPKFSDASPKPGKGGLDFWSWDWLNMVFYEFHFGSPLQPEGYPRMSVLLISDSGYFCTDATDADQTDITTFLPPERSQTYIGFLISGSKWPHPGFMDTQVGMKTFIEGGGRLPLEYAAEGLVGRCWNLSRLLTEEGTDEVIDDLLAAAVKAKIALRRIETRL